MSRQLKEQLMLNKNTFETVTVNTDANVLITEDLRPQTAMIAEHVVV